jgi:hypothetical protein
MTIPLRPRLLEYQIDKLGKDATFVEYTRSGVDSYGDEQYTTTEIPLKVIISTTTNTRMPFQRSSELGHYYMMQVEFFARDKDENGDAFNPPNFATKRPPELVHEGLTYEITEFEDSGIGAIRLIGYRERQ